MATIDSSIALGVKPVQIQDPINQFARQQELSVNMMKANEMQRGLQEEEAIRNYLRGADLSKPETRAGLTQFGKTGLAYGKALTEQEGAAAQAKKTKLEINEKTLKAHRERTSDLAFNPSPQNVTAHIQDAVLRGDITPEQGEATLQQTLAMSYDQRKQYFTQMGVDADKRLSDMTTRRGQDLTYSAATQPVFSEASGGFYTRPTAGKESTFIPAGGTEMTTKGKAVGQAKENVTTLASEMAKGYKDLKDKNAIKSTEAGAGSNLSASSQSSMVGQFLGSTFGTEEQDIRDYIKSQRPLLVQAMVKATGMSAQQINSNAELKNMLDAATDPAKGYESNIRALNGLNRMFGTGNPILPGADGTPSPAPGANLGPNIKTPGSNAAPAARPSLDSIFGSPKKL